MSQFDVGRIAYRVSLSLVVLALLSQIVTAQSVKVEGLIKARNGDTMILQTSDSPNLTVLLTDNSKVGQVQGVFKARRKQMSMAALIPGLAVKVEGTYNDHNELVATSVSFKGNDLEQAEAIEAGMDETKGEVEQGKGQALQNKRELEKKKDELKKQKEKLQKKQKKNAANKEGGEAGNS